MVEKIAEERWKHMVETPYTPITLDGRIMQADMRVAHALEYIAAQMGEINAKLGQLVKLESSPTRG